MEVKLFFCYNKDQEGGRDHAHDQDVDADRIIKNDVDHREAQVVVVAEAEAVVELELEVVAIDVDHHQGQDRVRGENLDHGREITDPELDREHAPNHQTPHSLLLLLYLSLLRLLRLHLLALRLLNNSVLTCPTKDINCCKKWAGRVRVV